MKKIFYISICASILVFILQLMWIYNIYKEYENKNLNTVDKLLSASIDEYVSISKFGVFEDPDSPKLVFKNEKDMSMEERSNLQGDTLKLIGDKDDAVKSMQVLLTRILEDKLIDKNLFDLEKVNQIFAENIQNEQVSIDYYLVMYDKNQNIIKSTGITPFVGKHSIKSKINKIGSKGLYTIQCEMKIKTTPFIRNMSIIISLSIVIMIIVIGSLFYQLKIIRNKEIFLSQRENCVNGTVHELKSPMSSIVMILTLIRQKENEDSKIELLDMALANIERSISDIESLLITAKRKSERILIHKSEFNTIELIEEIIDDLSIQYSHKPYTINIINSLVNNDVVADKAFIKHAIKNLIENSLKYSDDNVNIKITLNKDKKYNIISIQDDGWGIDPKYLKHIFENFYRVPNSKGGRKGYGIGLSYVDYILKAHKGEIKVVSTPNEGSVFTCYLPI